MKENVRLCMGCMHPMDEGQKCSYCSFINENYQAPPRALRPGTVLQERYMLGRILGEGSFGITYIGRDLVLGTVVAVKEYFPLSYVTRDVGNGENHAVYVYAGRENHAYQKGLERFYQEAKILAQFYGLEGVVSVLNFFYANETAYLVMEYIEGITLKEKIRSDGAMSGNEVFRQMRPMIEALSAIHEQGIIHRDISPDNILIREDGKLVLIDFGSARQENREMTQSMTVMFKRGYTPGEQYRGRGKQGPYTDVYSLCCVMYFMLTARTPSEALERMLKDNLPPLVPDADGLSRRRIRAIAKGMEVSVEDRYQTMDELLEGLYSPAVKHIAVIARYVLAAALLTGVLAGGIMGVAAGWHRWAQADHLQESSKAAASISAKETQSGAGASSISEKETQSGEDASSISEKETQSGTNTSAQVSEKELQTKVPSLVGLRYKKAVKKLKKRKLKYKIKWIDSEEDYGSVLGQSIEAGQIVAEGKQITLRVSNASLAARTQKLSTTQQPAVTKAPGSQKNDSFIGTIP